MEGGVTITLAPGTAHAVTLTLPALAVQADPRLYSAILGQDVLRRLGACVSFLPTPHLRYYPGLAFGDMRSASMRLITGPPQAPGTFVASTSARHAGRLSAMHLVHDVEPNPGPLMATPLSLASHHRSMGSLRQPCLLYTSPSPRDS